MEALAPDASSPRQLTVRAALVGMALGGVLSLSNLYIVLKTGWSFGVTITAKPDEPQTVPRQICGRTKESRTWPRSLRRFIPAKS